MLASVAALTEALAGCGGGGGDGDATARRTGLAGLYAYPEAVTGGDEAYLEIDGEGGAIFWDYLGDAVDRGPNCFYRVELFRLVPLGGDEYAAEREGERLEGTGTLRRDGEGGLLVSGIDTGDADGDGDVTEVLEERLDGTPGLSTTDFTECTDEQVRLWFESVLDAAEGTLADPVRPKRALGVEIPRPALPG